MKGFALILLCALVAVQARNTGLVKSVGTAAALGEKPYVVHLRIAIGSSGLLQTGAGTLISSEWVLTAASTLSDARFIWLRYGVVNVINPSLVTESTTIRVSGVFGLVGINRVVQATDFIAPVALSASGDVSSGTFCGFGADESGENPGEALRCYDASDAAPSRFDQGGGLVSSDGAQTAIVLDGEFGSIVDALAWIEDVTGVTVPEAPESSESSESDSEESCESYESSDEDVYRVHFVN